MRFIPTAVHGLMDYLMGLVLMASPWLFNFDDNTAQTWVPVIMGAGVIAYSLFTDYEAGLVRTLSMDAHLWLDGLGGAVLAASPWLFGFADQVWIPHVAFGIAEIGAALCTETVPRELPHRASGTRASTM